jgi:hypothetical protein
VDNLTLFGKEVLPRLKQRSASRITVSRELEQAGT